MNFSHIALSLSLASLPLLSAVGAEATPTLAVVQKSLAVEHLNDHHSMLRLTASQRYLLIPVGEQEEVTRVALIVNNQQVHSFNVKLATDHVDYYVPVDLAQYEGKPVVLDLHLPNKQRQQGLTRDLVRWNDFLLSATFDTANREAHRPLYHHTPPYGWMNDPNGLFYKDGVYHLYYQYNPYGSQWENMTWGHSTSTDLVRWKDEGVAIAPDALGTIFSGCSVVDHHNTAGFGKGAVVAFYTSAGASQTQSMAYSTDNGKTFTKYEGNPILTANIPDYRDPHIFWHEATKRWVMLLAAGQEMWIYNSADLKTWDFASKFGTGYGNHAGVWECPDLMPLKVRGTNQEKWMLICNINPGGPFGGSATQYFVGDFDGRTFTCESKPEVTKWMDYGKDHYATVTFDNAPDNRRIAIAWMSNWQYANQVPTRQFRSANSIARDLGLFNYQGETYVSVVPSKEILALRGEKVKAPTEACEILIDIKHNAEITLSNAQGEQVVMRYDAQKQTFSMDRAKSGDVSFSKDFPAFTQAPTHGKLRQLRLFIDRCSIEAFDADGKMAMTNLVFPSTPYDQIKVKGGKATIYNLQK